ncbi:MAG TPA: hypothetical protein VG097_08695, partial [Gemmata sp.]|nr:hypothetical protein [Gemmata sp.]
MPSHTPGVARLERISYSCSGHLVLLSRFRAISMQITGETVAILWLGAGAVALWMLLPAVLSALGLTFSQLIAGTDSFLLPVIVIACGFLWPVVESFLFR